MAPTLALHVYTLHPYTVAPLHPCALHPRRVVKGMDVVQVIERSKADKKDKPYDDIKIVNITLLDAVEEGL